MTPSAEMTLGLQVMKRLALKKKGEGCEGCEKDWPSQRDHACLMMAAVEVGAEEFILALAKEAMKKGITLERPHDTYKWIKLFHQEEIEDEVDCLL